MSSTPSGAPRQLPRRGSLNCGSAPSRRAVGFPRELRSRAAGASAPAGAAPAGGRIIYLSFLPFVPGRRIQWGKPPRGFPLGREEGSRGTFRKVPRAILWFLSHRGERNAPRRAALPARRIGIKQKDILFMSRLSPVSCEAGARELPHLRARPLPRAESYIASADGLKASLRQPDFFLPAKKKSGKEKAPKGTFVVANLTGCASAVTVMAANACMRSIAPPLPVKASALPGASRFLPFVPGRGIQWGKPPRGFPLGREEGLYTRPPLRGGSPRAECPGEPFGRCPGRSFGSFPIAGKGTPRGERPCRGANWDKAKRHTLHESAFPVGCEAGARERMARLFHNLYVDKCQHACYTHADRCY